AVPALHPDAFHLRLHLAMAVGTNAAAGTVAQGLRTVHRAGHAGRGEGALPAHLAIEQQALGALLQDLERLLQAVIADAAPERVQRHHHLLESLVEAVEAAGVADRPEADGIHRSGRLSAG